MLTLALPRRAPRLPAVRAHLRDWYRAVHAVPAGTKVAWAFLLPAAVVGATLLAGGRLGSGREALLLLLLATATITDLLWRRIFNWITVPAVLWAVGLSAVAQARTGVLPPADALTGLGVCFGIMFVLYLTFRGGEGDVKLMAAVGALVGWWHGVEALAFGYLLAAAAAVVVLAVRAVRAGGWPSRKGVLPMAPFFAAGTLLTLGLTAR